MQMSCDDCLRCILCLPSLKSNLPSNVVPLNDSEARVVYGALQGTYDIKGIIPSEAMMKTLQGVINDEAQYTQYTQATRPARMQYYRATVTSMEYVLHTRTTGPHGSRHQFELSKSPETGQIYLDKVGTTVATQGWPHQRPMADQEGEVLDFVTPMATGFWTAIRWTRTGGGSTVKAGEVQQQPQATGKGVNRVMPIDAGGDGAAEVKRLMELRDQGVLSEDEFTAAKKKALGI